MYQDPAISGPRVPDSLINLRQFVGGLNQALNDQSYAYTDATAYNPPGQFVTMAPSGQASIEGQPVIVRSADGGLTLSPVALVLAAAAAAYFAMRD